jgi:hypothetical protein
MAAHSTDVSTGGRVLAVDLSGDTTCKGVRAVYVGTTGNIKVDGIEGGTETLKNHPVGYMLVQPSKIYSTANGTTAADLVLIF